MEAEPTTPPTEEQSTPAPQPLTMERTNSSEMGSDSSVSTEYFTKDVASRSSHSEVESAEDLVAPGTPRSLSDREEASRLLSPSMKKDNDEQKAAPDAEKKNDKGESEKATQGKAEPENRNALPKDIAKGVAKDQAKTEAKDRVKGAYSDEQPPGSGTGAGTWAGPTQGDEAKDADYTCPCSSCCESCTVGNVIFNVLSCICFPVTISQMVFTGVCCRCPRLIASVVKQTANSVKSKISKGKSTQGTEEKFSTEHSDLEEPETEDGSSAPKPTKPDERSNENNNVNSSIASAVSKSGSESTSKPPAESTKDDEGDQEKIKTETVSGIENPKSSFFPSPEAADDRPGGDKPGGR